LGIAIKGVTSSLSFWLVLIPLVITAIGFLINKLNEPTAAEKKFEALAEQAEEAKNRVKETAQAVEDLKSGIDKYNEVYSIFSECTRGTEEWYNSLNKVNDEVKALLEKFPELEVKVDSVTGALTFVPESLEEAQKEAEHKNKAAELANTIIENKTSEQSVNVASQELDVEITGRTIKSLIANGKLTNVLEEDIKRYQEEYIN
jgi:chromosome segregation ATPase